MRSAAYDLLRDAIIRGELTPGELIKDTELADRLGLSRTPVREALNRLADAGLVESKPGVSTRVATLNRRDVEATLDVLRVLDELAVRRGVSNLTAEDLAEMGNAHDAFLAAVQAADPDAALEADKRFHGVLIAAAANPVLSRSIDQIQPALHRILYRKFSTLLGGQETVEHHRQLLELCADNDAAAVAELSATHWQHLGGLIGQLFDGEPAKEEAGPTNPTRDEPGDPHTNVM